MKKNLWSLGVLLGSSFCSIYGSNLIDKNALLTADKTGEICARTWEGVRISIPPGKEGIHYFFWFPKSGFRIPANTPIKVGAWMRTADLAGIKGKNIQLGGRIGLSDGNKTAYLWLPNPRSSKWRYVEKTAQWNLTFTKCTQNLYIAYYCSGTVIYDDIYFGPYTAEDRDDEQRGIVSAAKGTPVLDGKLDDDAWSGSSAITGLRSSLAKGGEPAQDQTEFRFLADDANLYVAVRAYSKALSHAQQQLDKFKAAAAQDGPGVLADDSVEIFLKRADGSLLQLGCNSKGFRYTGNGSGEILSLPWKCKATAEDGLWTAEIAVPWTSLGYAGPEKKPILFNVCRNNSTAAGMKFFSWAPVEYKFKEEAVFGKLIFPGGIPSFKHSILPLNIQVGTFFTEVTVNPQENWEGKISLEHQNGKEYCRTLERIQAVRGKKAVFKLSMDCRPGSSQRARFVVRDNSGAVVYRTPWYRIVCSASQAAVNNIKGAELKVNGAKIPSGKEFYLKKGKNLLQLGQGKSGGEIRIRNSGETLRLQQGESLNLEVEGTTVKCIDTGKGLYLEKGAAQVIPFHVREPFGKTLEIWVPEEIGVISFPEKSTGCEVREPIVPGGKKYLRHIVKLAGKEKTKESVTPYMVELPVNAPDQLPPIRFRVCGQNMRELWQELPLRILPAFTGQRPKKIRINMMDGFQYGGLNGTEASAMLKTLAKSGVNVFGDRKSALGFWKKDFSWAMAVRKAGITLGCEIHNHGIIGVLKGIQSLNGKNTYLSAPVGYITGEGRDIAIRKLKHFAETVKPDEMFFDMECSPDSEFDTSKSGLERFARFARLNRIPDKNEIRNGGALRSQWVDFCCHEVAEYAAVLKAGIQAGHPSCKFIIYSSYQGEKNRAAYSLDWKLLGKLADIGSCGYGFPGAETTRITMENAGGIPFESGILIYQANHAGLNDLTNDIINRIIRGYAGVMFYETSVIDGFSRRKIADAANLISKYEDFFIKPELSENCNVSGSLLAKDAYILSKRGKHLFLYLNRTPQERSGTVELAGAKVRVKAKPFSQFTCQF